MKVLVDTCIIIDALQSRVPFAEVAQKILYILQISILKDISRLRLLEAENETEQNNPLPK